MSLNCPFTDGRDPHSKPAHGDTVQAAKGLELFGPSTAENLKDDICLCISADLTRSNGKEMLEKHASRLSVSVSDEERVNAAVGCPMSMDEMEIVLFLSLLV